MEITESNIENDDVLEVTDTENASEHQTEQTDSTSLIEYKEVDEPLCCINYNWREPPYKC